MKKKGKGGNGRAIIRRPEGKKKEGEKKSNIGKREEKRLSYGDLVAGWSSFRSECRTK